MVGINRRIDDCNDDPGLTGDRRDLRISVASAATCVAAARIATAGITRLANVQFDRAGIPS